MQEILDRLNRLRLHKKWSWLELSTHLDISYSMLNKIKANERGLSEQSALQLARLELDSGMPLADDEPAVKLHKASQPYTLREVDRPNTNSELEIWKRRAQTAERKLNDLRIELGKILQKSDPARPLPISSTDEDLIDAAEKLVDEEMAADQRGAGAPTAQKPAPSGDISPGSKKRRAPVKSDPS